MHPASSAIALLLLAAVARGDQPDRLTRIEGPSSDERLIAIAPDGAVTLESGQALALDQLQRIERIGAKTAAALEGTPQLWLIGGGQLRGEQLQLRDETVSLTTAFGAVHLPLEAVRAVVLQPRADPAALQRAIERPSSEFDLVLASGESGIQQVEGVIDTLDGDKVGANSRARNRRSPATESWPSSPPTSASATRRKPATRSRSMSTRRSAAHRCSSPTVNCRSACPRGVRLPSPGPASRTSKSSRRVCDSSRTRSRSSNFTARW